MPGVVLAVASIAASLGAAIGGPVLGAIFGNFVLNFGARIIGSLILNAVSSALFGKKTGPSAAGLGGFVAEAVGRTQIIRSAIEAARFVYGEQMVSGPLVFAATSGANDEFLHLVVPVAAHEIEGFESFFLNDTEILASDLDGTGMVTTGDFAGKVRIKRHLGADDQAADADLVSEVTVWTTAHRLRGNAYFTARLEHARDVFPAGIPNVKTVIRGKKIYDTRTSVTAYSSNLFMIARDFLLDERGFNGRPTEIDEPSWNAAANISDEFVTLNGDTDTFTVKTVTESATFTADAATDILTTTSEIGIATADAVVVSTTGGIPPAGLTNGQQYWFTRIDANTVKIAATGNDRDNRFYINVTDAGTGAHTFAGQSGWSVGVGPPSTFSKTAHGLGSTGSGAWATGGSVPSPLVGATVYYAIRFSATTFKLASTAGNANAGTAIDLTNGGLGTLTLSDNAATPRSDKMTRTDANLIINTGDRMTVATPGTLPSPLAAATNYYYIKAGPLDFKMAASHADALAATAIDITDTGSGTLTLTHDAQIRYDGHGTVSLEGNPGEVIENILTAAGGAMVYTGGKHFAFAAAATTANADGIDETWLRGDVVVRPRVKRAELFNHVRGKFVNPAKFWTPTDFQPVSNVNYEVQDSGVSDTFSADAGSDLLTVSGAGGWFETLKTVAVSSDDTLPGALAGATRYWVIKISATTLKLAANVDDALSATAIDISDAGTGTHTIKLAEQFPRDIELPFTTNDIRAQRIAKIHLEKSRQGITVELPCNFKALPVAVWDVVKLTLDKFGFAAKEFRVIEWRLAGDLGIDLILQEEASTAYDWNSGDATTGDSAPDTTLTTIFTAAAPTALTLASGTDQLILAEDGTVHSRLKFTWTSPADIFVTDGGQIEIQWKKSAVSTWDAARVSGGVTEFFAVPVQDVQSYDGRVRAINAAGVRSDADGATWAQTVLAHTVVGKTALPANVATLAAQQNGNVVVFSWPQVADIDLAGYEIRYMATPFVWADATPLTEVTRGTQITTAGVPPGAWVLGIKARDTSENYSAAAVTAVLTVSNTNDIVKSLEAGPDWLGTKTNLIEHWTGKLVLDDQQAAAGDNFDIFDTYVVNPYATAAYEIAAPIDLGFDSDGVRVWADVVSVLGPGEASGSANPSLRIDTRDDAASFDGFEDWTVGTADFRHLKSKIVIDTSLGLPVTTGFNTVADIAERTESGQGVAVAISGTAISFAERFHQIPVVQATAIGASALIAVTSNVTVNGFTLTNYDTSGADVGGTADWLADGA